MSRLPNETTPVEIILATGRAVAPWLDTHRVALGPELDADLDEGVEVQARVTQLDLSWSNLQRERREDVQVTADKQAAVGDTRTFMSSVSASVQRRAKQRGLTENILRDFFPKPPSYIRNPTSALRALKIVRNAIKTHSAIFTNTDQHDLAAELDQHAANLIQRHQAIIDAEAREYGETRIAARAYEIALDQLLDAIEDLSGAADAILYRDGAPREALDNILDKLNPAPAPAE